MSDVVGDLRRSTGEVIGVVVIGDRKLSYLNNIVYVPKNLVSKHILMVFLGQDTKQNYLSHPRL